MALELSGNSAIVLGGVGGIGQAILDNLLAAGVTKLGVIDLVDEQKARENLDGLLKKYKLSKFLYAKCSVEDEPALRDAMQKMATGLGGLDVVVNSVGILNELDPKKTILINYYGTVNSTLIGIELMRKDKGEGRKGGTIVNIASITGVGPHFWLPIYSGSKHAVVGFTRGLANQAFYERTGVKFITINPGITETTLFDVFYDKHPFPEMKEEVEKITTSYAKQKPDWVGRCIVEAIHDGENGSVWQVENSIIKKIELEDGAKF